jgi:cytochrome P450 monooxygenase
LQVFERLWHLNKIHEKVTTHTFFGTWENMRFYRYVPTAANWALKAYEDGWKEFNLDVIGEARKVTMNRLTTEGYY